MFYLYPTLGFPLRKSIFLLPLFFLKNLLHLPYKIKLFFLSGLFIVSGTSQSFSQCLKDLTDTKPIAITAITESGGYYAADAFNNADNAYGGWSAIYNPEPGSECWINVRFTGGAEIVKGYSITAMDEGGGNTDKAPSDWKLRGSNNGVTWTVLDTRAGEVFTVPGETHIYRFTNSIAYSYYQFYISQTKLTSATELLISQIQLFADVCLTGTVFQDNGDRSPAYNLITDVPLAGIPVNIITQPAGNIIASTVTNASGNYSFSGATVPSSGSFAVMITPPAGKIFVTQPANLWCSADALPSLEEEPPNGSVLFDYHLNTTTNFPSAVNRMLFAGGNLDFGLQDAAIPSAFGCGGSGTNLITEGNGGSFGSSAATWKNVHPHQKGFSFTGSLYSPIPSSATDYVFSNNSTLSAGNRGVLINEGTYTVTSFLGTLSDVVYEPYMRQMLNEAIGGWRKSYGATTGDVQDQFLAVNGATVGGLPFFKQTNLTLTTGTIYTLAFYGKHANSYAQGVVTDAQLVIELLDNANTVVTSSSLNLTAPASFTDDRPETPWQLRQFTFTAPSGGGPFTVQLRASTSAALGNDFYIDNVLLYACSSGTLPLKITNFTARPDKRNDVQLDWEIENVMRGVVETEYSRDGKSFKKFGSYNLQPAVTRYTANHTNIGSGIYYYRLKITNGSTVTYSSIQQVDTGKDGVDGLVLYPNPVADKLYIKAIENMDAIEIIDIAGKTVKRLSNINNRQIQIDTRQIAGGLYYVKLIKHDKVLLSMIVIQAK